MYLNCEVLLTFIQKIIFVIEGWSYEPTEVIIL